MKMDNILIGVMAVFLMLPFLVVALTCVLALIWVVKMIIDEITGW